MWCEDVLFMWDYMGQRNQVIINIMQNGRLANFNCRLFWNSGIMENFLIKDYKINTYYY